MTTFEFGTCLVHEGHRSCKNVMKFDKLIYLIL